MTNKHEYYLAIFCKRPNGKLEEVKTRQYERQLIDFKVKPDGDLVNTKRIDFFIGKCSKGATINITHTAIFSSKTGNERQIGPYPLLKGRAPILRDSFDTVSFAAGDLLLIASYAYNDEVERRT